MLTMIIITLILLVLKAKGCTWQRQAIACPWKRLLLGDCDRRRWEMGLKKYLWGWKRESFFPS